MPLIQSNMQVSFTLMSPKSLGSRNLVLAHPAGMRADCMVTSSHQESLAMSQVRGSLRLIGQTATTSRCSSPLLLSKLCAAAGPGQSPGQCARSACRRGPHTLGARLAPSKLVVWQMPGAFPSLLVPPVSAVRCHCPGCWPSAVEGVSWCPRNGRILTLQGGKEAQKVTWSFPCSSAGPSATNPCSKEVSVFLKTSSAEGSMCYWGTRRLPQITSSFFFFPSRPLFRSAGRRSPGTILPINRPQQPR